MPKQQQHLRERTKSLSYSGSIWSDKIVEKQRPLIRQLSLHAIGLDQASNLLAAGLHVAEGGSQLQGSYSWAFTNDDIKSVGPGRWGYTTGTLPPIRTVEYYEEVFNFDGIPFTYDGLPFVYTSGTFTYSIPSVGVGNNTAHLNIETLSTEPVVNNTSGERLPFLQQGGLITILPPGKSAALTPADGFLIYREPGYREGTAGTGLTVAQSSSLIEGDAPFILLGGPPYFSPETTTTVDLIRSQEAAWFLRLPEGIAALALETELGDLVAGTAYHQVEGWLVLRHDPYLLWPDGIAHATTTLRTPRGPKHYALRTDQAGASGRWVASYKRQSQSPVAFVKALAEVAGLPVFEESDQICGIDTQAAGYRYHTLKGKAYYLPGPLVYEVGSTIEADTFPRGILDLRCQAIHGNQWWEGRDWHSQGIDISLLRPGFTGFHINSTPVVAEAYLDSGGGLRGRLLLGQDTEEETRFWSWQAAIERFRGTETFARDVLGLTTEGETKMVNPLQIYATVLGPWLWVVESTLPRYHPGIWREVQDFIQREKPAGAIVASVVV